MLLKPHEILGIDYTVDTDRSHYQEDLDNFRNRLEGSAKNLLNSIDRDSTVLANLNSLFSQLYLSPAVGFNREECINLTLDLSFELLTKDYALEASQRLLSESEKLKISYKTLEIIMKIYEYEHITIESITDHLEIYKIQTERVNKWVLGKDPTGLLFINIFLVNRYRDTNDGLNFKEFKSQYTEEEFKELFWIKPVYLYEFDSLVYFTKCNYFEDPSTTDFILNSNKKVIGFIDSQIDHFERFSKKSVGRSKINETPAELKTVTGLKYFYEVTWEGSLAPYCFANRAQDILEDKIFKDPDLLENLKESYRKSVAGSVFEFSSKVQINLEEVEDNFANFYKYLIFRKAEDNKDFDKMSVREYTSFIFSMVDIESWAVFNKKDNPHKELWDSFDKGDIDSKFLSTIPYEVFINNPEKRIDLSKGILYFEDFTKEWTIEINSVTLEETEIHIINFPEIHIYNV